VLTIEGADQVNPNDHTGNDVSANINYDIALEILRMSLGFVALSIGKVDSNTAYDVAVSAESSKLLTATMRASND
jgi:hypothetical protein